MATPIRIKRSAVAGKKPTEEQLQLGELAVNFYDGKVFLKQDTGGAGIATGIVEVGGNLEQLQVSVAATTASLTLSNIGVAVTAILDEDGLASDRDDALATQQSIKSYVDAQVTAQDIDFAGDTGTGSVDLDSQTLTIAGTTNEIETVGSGNTLTVGLPNVVAITTSLTVGSATTITGSGIAVGIVTGTLDNNLTLDTSGTGLSGIATYNNSGAVTFTVTSDATDANTASTIVSRDGSGNFSAGTISADLTGVASTATKLETSRTFQLTGDVVASQISFDGTGNVSLAATIQPNSVGLGTDTTGDYVKSITGTANQITVSSSGEGSTPTLSIPIQLTAPQDVTVTRDLQVDRNINVNGNLTIGGTSNALVTQTLQVADADLVLGVRTDGAGNDISNDTTANHGGISIASTEGNPLINLIGAGETLPSTYKKIMWFKSGSFAGLGTDAWMINYGVGIGSTQFPEGTRLAVGSVQFTENDLSVVENINASGIVTALTFSGALTGDVTGTATTATNLASGANITTGTIDDARLPDLITSNINASSGVSTFTELKVGTAITMSAGIVTATTFDGNVTGTATTATNLADGANISTGIISDDRLPDLITSNINSSSGVSTFTELKVGTAITMSAGIVTATTFVGNVTGDVTGTATTATNLASGANITTGTIDDARLPDLITSNINASSGVSTFSELKVDTDITMSAGIITATTFSGSLTGTATTATNLADGANITTGTISDDRLPDLITSNINASSGVSTFTELKVGTAITMSAGIVTATTFVGNVTGDVTGTASNATKAGIATYTAEWILESGDGSDYGISGPGLTGTENDPTFYVTRGEQYKFTNNTGGHPFRIQSTPNGSAGTSYTDGITNNDAGAGTTLLWNVQFDSPSVLYYQCTTGGHGGMGGKIYIGNSGQSITVDGNVGVGTTNASGAVLASNTSIVHAGIVTANSYYGDGANLTNTGATLSATSGVQRLVVTNLISGTMTSAATTESLSYDATNIRLGIGTTTPTSKLHVVGDAKVTGIITALEFYGNGAGLTGVSAGTSFIENTDNQSQFIPFQVSAATTDISGISTQNFVFNPSTKRLGIGTGTPTSNLHVVGSANVTGMITASSLDAAISQWVLGANGTNHYTFSGPGFTGAENDPSLYLVRGQKYRFVNNSGGSHPFQIRNSNGGSAYSDGVTNNGAASGNIDWDVQFDTPNELYYQCTVHPSMGGKIYIGNSGESIIVGAAVTINSSGINAPTGIITANTFSGSGANLTTLSATNISSGTINDDRLPDLITSNINASSGVSTVSTLHVSNLTNNRVVIAGASKQLRDDADLTFNGTTLNVGTGITLSSSTNNISITGSYFGDGSELTNVDNQFNSGMTDRLHYVPGPAEDTALTFPSTSDKAYIIESIRVANVDTSVGVGTTVNIIVSLNDTYIAYNIPINNGGTLELIEQAIVAGPSDVIKMWNTNTGYVGIQTATNVYISYSTKDDPNSRYFSTKSAGISSDTTSVKTFTANATLESINIANRTDSGDYPVTVSIVTGSTTSHIVKDLVVPKYGAIELLDRQLVVLSGDIIKVSAGTTNTIDVIISGKEHA